MHLILLNGQNGFLLLQVVTKACVSRDSDVALLETRIYPKILRMS